jgi:CheY-like chemotaxis protein
MAGERQRCIEAGANDYVPKPVDTDELLAALRPWLPATLHALATAKPVGSLSATTNGAGQPSLNGPGVTRSDEANTSSPRGRPDRPVNDSISGSKILVVDDDYRNSFALSALLVRNHAEVLVAESGDEALAILEVTPGIDVVLMDIMMPGKDGYATMRAIRTDDRFKTLPIIALTGKVLEGERQRCIDAGASDYIPKPIDTAALLTAIRLWLPAPVEPPPNMSSSMDAAKLQTMEPGAAAVLEVVPVVMVDDHPA